MRCGVSSRFGPNSPVNVTEAVRSLNNALSVLSVLVSVSGANVSMVVPNLNSVLAT